MGNEPQGMKGLRTLEHEMHTFKYKHRHIMYITRLWMASTAMQRLLN